MAIVSVNQPQREEKKEKKDPWDDIIKGLQVAQSITGIATNVQQYGIQKIQKERLGREEEFAKEQVRGLERLEKENVLTPAMEREVFIVPKEIGPLGEESQVKGSREAISEKTGKPVRYFVKNEADFWLKNLAAEQQASLEKLKGLSAKDISELEFKALNQLADDPVTKGLNTRIQYFNAIKEGLARGDALGDRQAIIAYLKLIEPTSAVLPGEFEGMAQARGLQGRLEGLIDQIKAGNALDATMRKSLFTLSGKMLNDSVNQYYTYLVAPYQNFAKSKGMNADLFVNPAYKKAFQDTNGLNSFVDQAVKVVLPEGGQSGQSPANQPSAKEVENVNSILTKIK